MESANAHDTTPVHVAVNDRLFRFQRRNPRHLETFLADKEEAAQLRATLLSRRVYR